MAKKIYYSELCLLDGDIEQNILKMTEQGAENIEFMMDGAHWDDFYDRRNKIIPIIKRYDIGISLHPPVWQINITAQNRAVREASLQEHVKCIRFAAELGADHVVVHPGFCCAPFDKSAARRRARESMEMLLELADRLGVFLSVENVGTPDDALFDCGEYCLLLDGTGANAGFLLDVGHAHIAGWDIPGTIRALGPKLFGLHLHDNNGEKDSHLPMFEGSIDWQPILHAVGELPDSCRIILEFNFGTPLSKLNECRELLEKAL